MQPQRQHTNTNLSDVWREMVRAALSSGEPQKRAIPGDVSMKLTIADGRVCLLLARRDRMIGRKHLSLITGCCAIPRHATRTPAAQQARQDIGGRAYFAIEFSWAL
jgi:hypothetical protein